MSRVRTVSICCVFAVVASFALARVHPFGDAGLYSAKDPKTPILKSALVPAGVSAILQEKCADCHSPLTHTPIYGRFAPVSWLMERDITHGREAMNLARWDNYSSARQQVLAAKIVEETRTKAMPLPQYRMIHWNARLSDAEIRTLVSWARTTSGDEASTSEQATGAGDPAHGKELFEMRCTGCHSLTQSHEGPRLLGVYGRTSGAVPDFTYSSALKSAGIVWDDVSLEKWLTDPDAFIPGNNMDFLVPRPQERLDIISYLKQVSRK